MKGSILTFRMKASHLHKIMSPTEPPNETKCKDVANLSWSKIGLQRNILRNTMQFVVRKCMEFVRKNTIEKLRETWPNRNRHDT